MAPNREDALKKKREAEKLRMAKIRSDPELWKQQQEKERIKRKKKLEMKQIKLVKDMSAREHRIQKRRWRERAKKSYHNRKAQNKPSEAESSVMTPPAVGLDSPGISASRQAHLKKLGERKRRRCLQEKNKEINRLEKQVSRLKRKWDNQRKRDARSRNVSNSPMSKVNVILKTSDKKTIAKKLIFGETMERSLLQGYKSGSPQHKRTIRNLLAKSRHVLKRYRLLNMQNTFTSRFFSRALTPRQNPAFTALRAKIKAEVEMFFERDDVSRICPGKKDCVTYKKVKKQKRFLLGSLKDLHQKYCADSEHSSQYQVCYSSFCKLKPFWVLQPKVNDRNTCACKIHSNIELLITALYSAGAIDKKGPKDLAAYLCCDVNSVACLQRRCSSCVSSQIPFLDFTDKQITYEKWLTTKKEIILANKNKKIVKHTSKDKINTTLMELVDILEAEMKRYMVHEGIVIHQFREVDSLKKQLRTNEVLVHCDFSENYATKYGQEIQSFHFGGSRRQVTLHTVQVYFRTNTYSDVTSKSICSMSKSTDHGPAAVWAHMMRVFEFVRQSCPKVDVVHFLSDSPSTQYRNKTIFHLIATALKPALSVKTATWNYCAAGHGKGAPDGIGGTLKRTADALVAQGVDVGDFESFVASIQAKTRNIKLFVVEEEEISAVAALLPKDVSSFKGTMKVQQVVWSESTPNKLLMKSLSCLKCLACEKFKLGYHTLEDPSSEDEIQPAAILEVQALSETTDMDEHNQPSNQEDPLPSCLHSYELNGEISDALLHPGTYVLAKFDASHRSQQISYKYVCCLGDKNVEEPGSFYVQGLRRLGGTGKEFVLKENDNCVIEKSDILLVLPNPKITFMKRKVIYTFPFPIDVKEKR